MLLKPGVAGPKPSEDSVSGEKPTMGGVRPWELLWQTTISALSGATPFAREPHSPMALIAVSTASAPEFMGRARALPAALQSFSRNGPRRSLWNARDVRATFPSCALAAATILGWLWPWLSAEYAERKSK